MKIDRSTCLPLLQRDYEIYDVTGSNVWMVFKLKLDLDEMTATLTFLHNSGEEQQDPITLSPNIGRFTHLRFQTLPNVTYNFFGFANEGNFFVSF